MPVIPCDGGILSISANGGFATGPGVSFADSNNISFGVVGNTITASVVPDAGIGIAVPGTTIATGTAVLSNSNGVSFGINGSTITASVAGLTQEPLIVKASGTYSGTVATNSFLSFDWAPDGANGRGIRFVGQDVGANVRIQGFFTALGIAAGGSTVSDGAAGGAVVFSNSNGVTFGLNGSTVTASVAAGASATGNLGAIAAGTQTATSGTVAFADSNGVSFGMSGSSQVSAVVATLSASGTQLALITAASNISMTAGAFAVLSASNMFLGGSAVNIQAAGTAGNADVSAGSNVTVRAVNTISISGSNAVLIAAGANGSVRVGASNNTLGFFGQAGVSRQTLTGTDATAINNLFAILGSHGLVSNAATVSALATGNFGAIAAGTQTATSGTVVFSNSNGISMGMSGNSRVTAQYEMQFVVGGVAGTQSFAGSDPIILSDGPNQGGVWNFTAPNRIGYIVTAAPAFSAGTSSVGYPFAASTLVFSDSNGVSFGLNGSTITASAGGGASQSYLLVNGPPVNAIGFSTQASGQRVIVPLAMTATRLAVYATHAGGNTLSGSLAMYTMNGSTASRVSSMTFSGSLTAQRMLTFTMASWALTPGDYYLMAQFAPTAIGVGVGPGPLFFANEVQFDYATFSNATVASLNASQLSVTGIGNAYFPTLRLLA